MRPRKERRRMTIVRYDLVIIFFGATGSRMREKMTAHKTIKIETDPGIFTDTQATDQEAWTQFRMWINTNHPGEGSHVQRIERETIRSDGRRTSARLYLSPRSRNRAEPEPLPETMPINRGF